MRAWTARLPDRLRTWAQWNDAAPGFVEIDTVFHGSWPSRWGHALTLRVNGIATGWTENSPA